MENKSSRVGIWVIRIIGVVLLVAGVVMLIRNINASMPEMGDNDWMSARSARMFGIAGGAVMIMFGFMTTTISLIPALKNMSAKVMKNQQNNNVPSTLFDVIKDATGNREQFCDYCGSQLPKGKTKCDSCGAVKGKK